MTVTARTIGFGTERRRLAGPPRWSAFVLEGRTRREVLGAVPGPRPALAVAARHAAGIWASPLRPPLAVHVEVSADPPPTAARVGRLVYAALRQAGLLASPKAGVHRVALSEVFSEINVTACTHPTPIWRVHLAET